MIVATLAYVAGVGCQGSHPPPRPDAHIARPKPVANAKPLIDFGRGAGGFPLGANVMPDNRDDLITSLRDGYRARVDLPGDVPAPIIALGENFPRLSALAIDLSGAKIKPDFRPASVRGWLQVHDEALHVDHLTYTATPLQYVDGKTNLRIAADDVSLALIRGRDDKSTLVMTDAKSGRVDFEVPMKDLRTMMLASAKINAGKAGYSVSDVKFNLKSDSSRSLIAEATVGGWWLLVPSDFKIAARIDIDDDFNAHFSNVTCDGDNVGGKLLAGLVSHAMKRYEDRVMPLAGFPGNRIKIRDLRISVDDSLRVYVAFGS